jgi:hypothetical protein
MTLSSHLPQMSQEDAVRFLGCQGLSAGPIHQRLGDLFGDKAIGYSTATHTIRQLSWPVRETLKDRPANFSIDAAILTVLNGDSTASVREIAQEAKLSASTGSTSRQLVWARFTEDAHSRRIIYLSHRRLIVSGKVMNFWRSSKTQNISAGSSSGREMSPCFSR